MADGRLTALQAALAGIGGGVTSAQKYGETRRLEAERKRMFDEERARQARLDERQRELDRIGLLREGYMTPEAQDAAKRTGGAAVLRAALMGARDQAAIDQGLSAAAPQQTTTFGGQQYTRETPFAKAAREASRALYEEQEKKKRERLEKQGEFERNVQSAMSAYNMKRPQAEEYVRTGKSPFLPMSQQERDASARGWADINLRRKEQPGGGYAMPGQDFTQDLAMIKDYLPTVDEKTGALVPPKQKLTGGKMLAVQRGGPGGTLPGQITALGYTMAGGDLSAEQKYNTIAEGIATAYAIQEQRGRNVSDRDIMNRISQVVVQPNEVGNIEVQKLKGDRLQRWANAVMSGQVQQIQPGQTGAQPTFSERVSGAAAGMAQQPNKMEWARQWQASNPISGQETPDEYRARMTAAWNATQRR